jgi:hypothetical protein
MGHDLTPTPPPGWPFLRAVWANLFLATYEVPPELLRPRLPPGLELDTRDGRAFASLVPFQFVGTRVLGVGWPGYRDFPELNLRFYVRRGDERGVVFVREFVSSRLIAWLANTIYNEPYHVAPMRDRITDGPDRITAEYRIDFGGRTHTLRAVGAKPAVRPGPDSVEHFFKEHQWGYGTTRRGRLLRYEVWHPVWDVYPVVEHAIDVDWATLYGPEWAVMQDAKPTSLIFAAGSAVAVYPKGTVECPSGKSPPRGG